MQATTMAKELEHETLETDVAIESKNSLLDPKNPLHAMAHEVEILSEDAAHALLDELAQSVEFDYLRLGGILAVVHSYDWFKGHKTWKKFVQHETQLSYRTAEYLRSIYEFLGVDPDFESSLIGQRSNAAMFTRTRGVLNRLGLKKALRVLSQSPVGALVRRTKRRLADPLPQMALETRQRLVEFFRPYNQRLAAHLGRDLSLWIR